MTAWTKQDIVSVTDSISNEALVHHKGIFFINMQNARGALVNYLEPSVKKNAGVVIVQLNRVIMSATRDAASDPLVIKMLETVSVEQEVLVVVAFSFCPKSEASKVKFHFVVAHCVANVENKYYMSHVDETSREGRDRMMKLDAFACDLLGENKTIIEFLTHGIDLVLRIEGVKKINQLPVDSAITALLMQERIEAIQ